MLPIRLEFRPEEDERFFAELPASAAVFALRGEAADAEAYVSKTANLRRRAQRLLGTRPIPTETSSEAGELVAAAEPQTTAQLFPETPGEKPAANVPDPTMRRLNLRGRVRWLEYWPTGSEFESGFLLYRLLRREFPKSYQKRLHLRPAPLLRLLLENRYPRLAVTSRLSGSRSSYYGPFATRAAAEKFAGQALDFFLVRRCTDELNPDPAFPGCIYSQMKMCLAPCYAGCTDERYAAEVRELERFLDTGGRSLLLATAAERDRASERLEFERAAALHARYEQVQAVGRELPEIVRRLDRLRGVMVQASARHEAVEVFKIEAGKISDPVSFTPAAKATLAGEAEGDAASKGQPAATAANRSSLGTPTSTPTNQSSLGTPASKSKPHSIEARLSEVLATIEPARVRSSEEAMEHLAILKRWYYRGTKAGELFLADEKGELPMRRIVRGVSRVLKGEAPGPELAEIARDYWINRGREAER